MIKPEIQGKHINTGFVVQLGETTDETGKKLLKNFVDMPSQEVIEAGKTIHYNSIICELEAGGYEGEPLNAYLVTYLLDHGHEDLFVNNFGKFDESQYNEILIKYLEYLKKTDSDILKSEKNKQNVSLILQNIDTTDIKLVKTLIDKGYFAVVVDYMKNKNCWDVEIFDMFKDKGLTEDMFDLNDYKNEDKKKVVIEAIKLGRNPDLKPDKIPPEEFTQDFAMEIFNIGTDFAYKFLSKNMSYFDESIQKFMAIKYIESDQWEYVETMWPETISSCIEIAMPLINQGLEEQLKDRITGLNQNTIAELKGKKYDFKKFENLLGCFVEDDRKIVALEIINAGGEPDLSSIPKRDLTKDFALKIIDMKQDAGLKALSSVILSFATSLINGVVTDLVNAGGWKYIRNEVLKTNSFDNYLDKEFILALLRTEGITEVGIILKKLSNLDSEVALIFIELKKLDILATNLESFNNLNSEIAKSLINGGFKSIVKKNMERFNLDDETLNLLGSIKGNGNTQHGGKRFTSFINFLKGGREEHREMSDETHKILQELPKFRKEWEDREDLNIKAIREKIVNAADKIPVDIDIDSDGNKKIKLKLKNRMLQILIPRLENSIDQRYKDEITFSPRYDSAFDFNNKLHKSYVKLGGMKGNNVKRWANYKLKTYVLQKESEGFKIPSKKDMIDILSELGESAGLDIDDEKKDIKFGETPILIDMQMLLLMYLTGSPGLYWLSDVEKSSNDKQERLMMTISRFNGCFNKMDSENRSAGILMIK